MTTQAKAHQADQLPCREAEIEAFAAASGWGDAALEMLPGDASFRRYIRLRRGGETTMLMDAPPARENVRPYALIASLLGEAGYSAPRILARDAERGFVLLEDLGDALFTRVLNAGGENAEPLYAAAIDLLAEWHTTPLLQRGAAELPAYDTALLLQEASFFSDWFLPAVLGAEKAKGLRDEYLALWRGILGKAPLAESHFVHRDYHVDNLIWLPEREGHARIGLLDFQDGVRGDPAYDVVSLLEDARRDVPPELAAKMRARYLAAVKTEADMFDTAAAVLAAQRSSKIIGIFMRLNLRDGKPVYLKHIPRVWGYLMRDVEHPLLRGLGGWLDRHVPPELRGVPAR